MGKTNDSYKVVKQSKGIPPQSFDLRREDQVLGEQI